ncbi:putative hydrolase [Actinacidiphila reveromycinica]|uniref:Putative hydrolase n=1 Tax=Actinacidiphila reveromycinica TaxID=659352 RepID=A0A7U3UVL8_9ACTN|nr:GH25 family lysozyme [Streptomyces sp. SN-593]BBB01086.1 putative hydrolase [Streptomyces sp. SN-593]
MTGCEGQDWASYQSSTPSTTGLAFAAVKATESTTYTNSRHAAQVAHARAAGLVIIHYHFVRPGSMAAQIAYFLKQAVVQTGDVLCLDWEDTGVSGADKDTFLKALQKAAPGHRVILYCNIDFWKTRDTTSFAADGLWIADPSAAKGSPRITAPWLMHQYSEAGGIDRDYCNLTATQLRAWAAGTTPTPEDDVALTTDDINKIAAAVWAADVIPAARPPHANDDYKTNPTWTAKYGVQAAVEAARTACDVAPVALTDAQVTALGAQLAGSATFATAVAEQVADLLAQRLQS